jgi:catechol 2,3-dioxygenase-like lactoylglutathione lyase family enzyme
MMDLQTIPVFRSADLEQTSQFYAQQLGFEPERVAPDYLIVRRGAIELHFCPPDYALSEGQDTQERCYIRGTDIDALHDEFAQRGVVGFKPFVQTPWDMFEFYVSDPSGILLIFGRSVAEGAAPTSLT